MTHTEALRAGRISPCGEGAITIFRLRGSDAAQVLTRIFRPRGARALAVEDLRVGTLILGGEVHDAAVVRTNGNGKITEVDLSVHGGQWLADQLEHHLRKLGAEPLDDTDGAGLYDPWKAGPAIYREAQRLFPKAFAEAQLAFFLNVMSGNLARTIRSLSASVSAVVGAPTPAALLARIDSLLSRQAFGRGMADPPVAVLSGLPNSGKSTLFNQLLGRERAIVSEIAGTTRDALVDSVAILGFPFVLVDTAGQRETTDPIERTGVSRAVELAGRADVRIVVIDATRSPEEQSHLIPDASDGVARGRTVIVVSKPDLADAGRHTAACAARGFHAVACVAPKGDGLPAVRSTLVRASPFGSSAVSRHAAPFSERQVEALRAARQHLANVGRDGQTRAFRLLDGVLDDSR